MLALQVYYPETEEDDMGAPRLDPDEKKLRLRARFRALIPYDELPILATETGVHLQTWRRWWNDGTSQPET